MCEMKFLKRAKVQVEHGIGAVKGSAWDLAVDPGGTTGLAWSNGDGEVCVAEISSFSAELVHGLAIVAMANKGIFKTVIMEDFSLDMDGPNGGRDGLSPVRIASMVGGQLAYLGILRVGGEREMVGPWPDWKNVARSKEGVGSRAVDLVFQMPALAKRTLTDERQKRAGLWVAGMEHARDAVKHLYTYRKVSGIAKVE